MLLRIARDGYRFIGIFIGISILLLTGYILSSNLLFLIGSVIGLIFGIMCGLFFRDPSRIVNRIYQDGNHIISPADGTIDLIEYGIECDGDSWDKISIFLSIFDVHINRSPANGTITRIKHRQGSFGNAFNSQSSRYNEAKHIYLTTKTGFSIIFTQIAGMIARRIVGFSNCKIGSKLDAGERFGLIRFGSRMNIYLPAGQFLIRSKLGDRATGGVTLLAEVNQ